MIKFSLVSVFLFALVACKGSSQSWPPHPAEIQLGESVCAACKMIISEERYGAQLHYEHVKPVQLFDDYGCLLKSENTGGEPEGRRMVFVRSFQDGEWIPQDQAAYVVSKEISSPMGYGIAAFASEESATTFAKGLAVAQVYSSPQLMAAADQILHSASQEKE